MGRMLLALCLSGGLLLGCQVGPETGRESPEPEIGLDRVESLEADMELDGDELSRLTAGNRAFALAAFQQLLADSADDDNLLISPHSILSALAMVYAGAAGETRDQMQQALRLALDGPALHLAFEALDAALAERSHIQRNDQARSFNLHVVNRIWAHYDYTFVPAYLTLVQRYYGAGIEPIDFRSDPDAARRQINAWVEEQTQDRILDLLPDGSLDEETRMVLVNAIHFLASWQDAFDTDHTQSEPFMRIDGSRVEARMMHRTGPYPAHVDDHSVAVSMPYLGGEVSLLAMMPARPEADFGQWLDEFDQARFDAIVADLTIRRVALALPRFSQDSSFRLAELLSRMGMPQAFSEAAANFERMTGVGPGVPGRSLYVDEVFHKTFIDLDEAGTEAAAATAVSMVRVTAMPVEEEALELRFDRPFIYAIYDHPTASILFLGRMLDPS